MKNAISILLLLSSSCFGQNLVPNPSFEDTVFCPTSLGGPCLARNWELENWVATTCATPDCFNECHIGIAGVPSNAFDNNAPARTGKGYMGVHIKTSNQYREYITVDLSSSLETGKSYELKFYVKYRCGVVFPCHYGGPFTDDIGAYISIGFPDTTGANGIYLLPLAPQINQDQYGLLTDTVNWQPVTGIYTALGGENHITIGNFNPDSITTNSYLFIDDVSLIELTSGLVELASSKKELIRIVDTMGRQTDNKPNTILIYIYSDGTVERIFRTEY